LAVPESSRGQKKTPPADFDKWAEICCRIIAHYNEGWGDGFRHGIEYWEIWNEADGGALMWAGTWDDYGFGKTELHLNEWHYAGSFGNLFKSRGEERRQAEVLGMNGADGAAFTCEALTRFQDTVLDMANFYTGTVLVGFGIFDSYAGRTKSYYALLAFARMLACSERVAARTSSPHTVTVLAGRKPDGTLCALVSCFRNGVRDVEVEFGVALREATALVLDETRNLEPVGVSVEGSRVKLAKQKPSSVFLVEAG
jgi:hypothetical protein